MEAVIETGGKQYRVGVGQELKLEKLKGEVGDMVTFDRVLLRQEGDQVEIGRPYLAQVKVEGRITQQGRDRKIIVFRYIRTKDSRRKRGHRQPFTRIRITGIQG